MQVQGLHGACPAEPQVRRAEGAGSERREPGAHPAGTRSSCVPPPTRPPAPRLCTGDLWRGDPEGPRLGFGN